MARKRLGSSTPSIMGARKAAIVAIVLLVAGVVALLVASGVWFLFFALVALGIVCLGVGNAKVQRLALGLFGVALVILGIGLCPLLD